MKDTFILYTSYKDAIMILSDEQAGRLLKAIFEYATTGVKVEIEDMAVKFAYMLIVSQIESSNRQYEKKCERNRENAAKRWQSMATENIQTQEGNATECDGIRTDATECDGIRTDATECDGIRTDALDRYERYDRNDRNDRKKEEDNKKAEPSICAEAQSSFDYSSVCHLYKSPSPRDLSTSRMPSSG